MRLPSRRHSRRIGSTVSAPGEKAKKNTPAHKAGVFFLSIRIWVAHAPVRCSGVPPPRCHDDLVSRQSDGEDR